MTPLHLRHRLRAALFAFAEPPTVTIHLRGADNGESVDVRHAMHPSVLARRLRIIADRLEEAA